MHLLLSLASFLLSTVLAAEPGVEPWGHWEGTITAQFGTLRIELDLTRTADGTPTATFSAPERKLKGLPVVTLTVNGRSIAFEPAAVNARFQGQLSDDGTEIAGTFEASAGTVPVTLVRRGEAHLVAPPTSAAIDPRYEGTWNGTLDVDGGKRIRLTLINHDRTAAGTMVSVDEGGLALPVGVAAAGGRLTIDVPAVSSTYSAALSADGLELVGTYTTPQGMELPLTLRRK